MIYKFLSGKFYQEYPCSLFPEIEQKPDRPYVIVCIVVNQHEFALPLRSHINHKFAFFTDKQNWCGVDFSKAIYISDLSYIDNNQRPFIRQNEFSALIGKEYIVKQKFLKYVSEYVNAKKSGDKNKLQAFRFSTLPYFENKINYEYDILNSKQMSFS